MVKRVIFWLCFLICSSLFLFSCVTKGNIRTSYIKKEGYEELPYDTIKAKVVKIESLEDHYLIQVRKGKKIYRILSRKYDNVDCEPICLNSSYVFIIKKDMDAWNYPLDCRLVGKTIVSFKDGKIIGLYYPANMKGLCIFAIE